MTNQTDPRFGGIERLYGAAGLRLFQRVNICVVGIGGVGSWVAEALVRSGVQKITLIDLDDICITNVNRQIHALTDTVGESKVEVMAQRLKAINPACDVVEVDDFVTRENIPELIGEQFDYIIDAIDSVKEKAALIAHCKRRKLGIITVGGAGGQMDPTRIDICDLSKTNHDPLAAKVRSLLRREYNFSKSGRRFAVDCVYSTEQLVYPQPDGSVCQMKSVQDGNTRLDCSGGFGASTCVTASFAFAAVSRVLQKLIEKARRENAFL